jgi:DNA-directed RNA polymerase subunit RPC12/RpoP
MKLVCPECKNDVDLSVYPNLNKGHVIECNTCGITLEVKNVNEGEIEVEVMDEGK